ncbi:MAG: trigger factor [Desulfobacterales bacterium]
MQVTVEDVSSVKKVLHIEIPEDKVTRELDIAYGQLKKTAKIRGFRPGKAPRGILERMFKKEVQADVSSKLIQESFIEAIKETDLKIVGNPKVDPPVIEPKTAYKYDATVEISPKIEKIEFKGLKLKKAKYQVNDSEIQAQLKMLQKNMAQLKSIDENRPAKKDDVVLIDYEGFKDGKPFSETQAAKNSAVKIGDGSMLKDFDENLVGMKPGDEKEFDVRFPQDYSNKKLSGLNITFQVKLNEIKEEILPKIDDELAKDLGEYNSLDELKNAISDNMEQSYAKKTEQELNQQIFNALMEKTEFEVPESLVDAEVQEIVTEAEKSFSYQNRSLEELGLSRESLSEQYRETAEKKVRRHFILSTIIDQENMDLSDEDLEAGLKEISETHRQPLEDVKNYYAKNEDKLTFLKHTLLEKQAIGLIIKSGKIEEVEPEKNQADTVDNT